MTHSRGAAGAGPDWLPQEINTDVGTVALSDHPVWLPPLRRSNLADHSHDRVVRVLLGGLPVRWASTSLVFAGVSRLNATVPPAMTRRISGTSATATATATSRRDRR